MSEEHHTPSTAQTPPTLPQLLPRSSQGVMRLCLDGQGHLGELQVQVLVDLGGDLALGLEHLVDGGVHVLEHRGLSRGDVRHGHLVQVALGGGVHHHDLLLDGHGVELALLQDLGQAGTALQHVLGGSVQVGAELGEGSHLTVLRQLQLQGTGHLLHGGELGGGAHAGHGQTDVQGGADTLVEQLSLQEDLAVRDGNHVGGDVRGHVAGLGLNDGEGGEGAAAHGLGHLGGALQQAGVEVEHVTGERLTAGGTAQQQRHLAVGHRLLGQIIVDDQRVLAGVAEVLGHGAGGVGRQELQGRSVRGGGRHDDGVLEGTRLLEQLDQLSHGGALLADGHVHAVHAVVLVGLLVAGLLVQDAVHGNGGLAGLAITDDQLTLATANGHQGVHGLDASVQGLAHRLAGHDTGSLDLHQG
mmetsp:Transcript_13634/g.33518  ORF Transcript_13634/g.33518 Transcript_13634/m.33518 type:complete len:413 (-) Transcript_13634:136-1374(-)